MCRWGVPVLIDSCCTHNIVDENTWAALKQNAIKCASSVNPTGKQLYTYASNQPPTIKGTFGCNVQAGNKIAPAEFFVIKGKGIPLIGKDTAMTLEMLKIGNNTAAIAETSGAKTIKKNTNSTQNKFQTHRAKQYEVTSILSTDCELSTETCSKNVYSLGPRSTQAAISCYVQRYG